MKMRAFLFLFVGSMMLLAFTAHSQTFIYKLHEDFSGNVSEAPPLVPIPNNSGFTGAFTGRSVPSSTCEGGGTAGGYFFEDDAGLQFNCPPDFIGESYSLSMIFQIDELIAPPSWVRILSFTHVDDHGVYIYLTNPPENGTLEFWPNGTVGETNFFNTEDFYQLILVRDAEGLIKIYVNGTEFSEYDDSGTQEYKFHDPDNYLIFFRDHPSVLANEASPGFVSNIKITNQAWSPDDVAQEWEDFCSSLLGVEELSENSFSLYPNPATDRLNIAMDTPPGNAEISIIDLVGKTHLQLPIRGENLSIDISTLPKGIYFVRYTDGRQVGIQKVVIE